MDVVDLKLERIRGGLTQAELGRRAGIAARRIGDIERGRTEPRPEEFVAIARALAVADAELAEP